MRTLTSHALTTVLAWLILYNGNSQTWEYLTPIRSYTQIKGCSFIDENRGVAVSYIDDAIIMTLDGGDTWQGFSGPPTVGTAMDIEWVTEDLFIIAASNGDLFRTVNGGATWQNMNPPTNDWLYNVDFINETTGFVTGNNGVMLKTTDAGATWTLIPTGTTYRIVDIDFSDELNGCAAAWSGTMLRTTDGGSNWSIIPIPTTASLQSVQFVDSNIGFASGGDIIKTTDGGITWTNVYSSPSSYFNVVYVNDNGQGYAVGATGAYIRTSNMGSTWQAQTSLGDGDIFCGDHTETGQAYLFGTKNIHKSINNGLSWTLIKNQAPGGNVNDLQFTNDNYGWCVSSAIGGNNNGGIVQTIDGGRTWNIKQTASSGGWYAVDFPSTQTGYVLGTSSLAKTTNGGQNWTFTTPFTLSGLCLHFLNTQTGFAGGLGAGSSICKTTNGGNSFSCGTNIGAAAIHFINDQKGIAVRNIQSGGDTYYKTFDGGNTWEYHNGVIGNCIDFFGEQRGWVGSYSGVYRTTDGGETWEFVYVSSGLFLDIRFFNENTGYCVNDQGLIYRTTDGGISWQYAFDNEEVFIGALCAEITENYCYLGTSWGGIYRTSLGCNGVAPFPCLVNCPNSIQIVSESCGQIQVELNNNNLENVVWSFGDGSSDTNGISASHLYGENGIYLVSAEFSSTDCGIVNITDTVEVNCHLDACPGEIIAQVDSCNSIGFLIQSADTNASVEWDFGDGQSVTGSIVTQHEYANNGIYIVSAVYNAPSCPIEWTQVYTLQVDCPTIECPSEITYTSEACGIFHFELDNAEAGSVEWGFDDNSEPSFGSHVTHTYTANGSFIVSASFTGAGCPYYTYTDTVNVDCLYDNCPPFIQAQQNTCNELSFEFGTGTEGLVTWVFGDGDTLSGGTTSAHTYSDNGLYVVSATYTGEACPIPWTVAYTVEIDCPEWNCTGSISSISDSCGSYDFSIAEFSAGSIQWDFGNGSITDSASTTHHVYSANGLYYVTALLTDSACGTITFIDTIQVNCPQSPCHAAFTIQPTGNPGQFMITNTSSSTNNAVFTYDYPNGGTDLGNGLVQFNNNGTYVICLSISDDICFDTYCDTLTIENIPAACGDYTLHLISSIQYFETGSDTISITISDVDSLWYMTTWHPQENSSDTLGMCLPQGCYELQLSSPHPLTAITLTSEVFADNNTNITTGSATLEMSEQITSTYFGINTECTVSTLSDAIRHVPWIYPNPASETVIIESPLMMESVVLYGNDGSLKLQLIGTSKRFIADVSSLSTGIYVARVTTSQGVTTAFINVVH